MGNKELVIDPEIRALTQLVSSFIQKRSSLNYQINQLKLAQNTKKTCIETKKLRDLKMKNANLVIEIKNSDKLLDKIKQKKYIKEKDLSRYVVHFQALSSKKSLIFSTAFEDLTDSLQMLESQKKFLNEKSAYLNHLKEKQEKLTGKLKKSESKLEILIILKSELDSIKVKTFEAQEKRQVIAQKHSGLSARRKLKRKQTLVIPSLPTNAFVLRSKLLLKSELTKQISELKADQKVHIDELTKLKNELEQSLLNPEDLESLKKLNMDKKTIKGKIFKYKSELEFFGTSPKTPFSPFLFKKCNDDSLNTDLDLSSEISVIHH